MEMEGEFSRYLEDVYSEPPVEREALDDECDILVVGGGFEGLAVVVQAPQGRIHRRAVLREGRGCWWHLVLEPLSGHRLRCRVIQLSAAPRGNGILPDDEIRVWIRDLEYCQSMARRFDFYDHCLFHTTVEQTVWDEDAKRWTVHTDRGDARSARYVVLANGILTTPRLARIDGMESYQGESFHTSRWDYNIDFEGKRVGIIGTGATSVQVVPGNRQSGEGTLRLSAHTIFDRCA